MLISVIIPTRNRRELLSRAVESVLAQTGVEVEVIVVDDASTDGTEALMQAWNDSRVRFERLAEPGGACAARNRGIALARGEYIAFQDSDDWWHPDKCIRQLEVMQKIGADIVFCAFAEKDEQGNCLRTYPDPRMCSARMSFERLLEKSLASTQTILCKAECLREERFCEEYPRLQDYELMLRLARKWNVYYHADVLVDVYTQPDSISRDAKKLLWALTHLYDTYTEAYRADEMAHRRVLKDICHAKRQCGESAWRMFLPEISACPSRRRRLWLARMCASERLRFSVSQCKARIRRK